jgi:hypothetical protein
MDKRIVPRILFFVAILVGLYFGISMIVPLPPFDDSSRTIAGGSICLGLVSLIFVGGVLWHCDTSKRREMESEIEQV